EALPGQGRWSVLLPLDETRDGWQADAVGSPEPGVFRDKRIRYSRRAGLVGGDVLDGDPSST
ncbi:MAG: hypothetical protein KDI08_08635, partial [Pseudomonadales bacterium]|nr:hypothetical protein [Pseudomonadales bacterium]